MNAITSVPVTITPEAAARVAELGMQAELEQMLERARQMIPGLTELQVVHLEPYDTGSEVGIGIEGGSDAVWGPGDTTRKDWNHWKTSTFPPQVWTYFTLLLHPTMNHEG